ncbi:MAG: 4-hydroxy-3-methylbut-2-enyl diphosphate reductase [Vampirovibrionales bacterium]|nr:4-hydroxy-3-methylbut-2-enyl diphosphate reductase [Vampirovibrionales bacterium]
MTTPTESTTPTAVIPKKTVVLAEHHGFCHGVKKAVDKTLAANQPNKIDSQNPDGKPVYVLGQLIHNQQMIGKLDDEGITTVQSLDEVPAGSRVVIRTHGAAPELLEAATAKGIEVTDATCPDVLLVQNKAIELAKEGYTVVIAGKDDHPEVVGIKAHAARIPNAHIVAINRVADIGDKLAGIPKRRIGLVSQTTQLEDSFFDMVKAISMVAKELKVFNTICPATYYRQNAAETLAQQVEFVVVVGGKNSSNTTHLAEVCAEQGTPTVHVETFDELKGNAQLLAATTVGVTAGASTPQWVVDEVVAFIEGL